MAQQKISDKAAGQLDELSIKAKGRGDLLKFKEQIANKAIDQFYKKEIKK